jgi:hypothetical protein
VARFNPIGWEDSVMAARRRIKHTATFEERLAEEAMKFKEAAEKQPAGSTARELLLRRARQAENGFTHQQLASISRPTAARGTGKSGFRSEEVRRTPVS